MVVTTAPTTGQSRAGPAPAADPWATSPIPNLIVGAMDEPGGRAREVAAFLEDKVVQSLIKQGALDH